MRSNGAKLRLLLSIVIFGTIGVFVRYLALPSGLIALCRGVIGTLFLLLYMAVKKQRLSWADIRRNLVVLCLSGVALGFNWMLLFEAYRYTTVATATLCYHMAPVMVILLSPLLFSEKLTWGRIACVGAAVLGMVLVSGVLDGGSGDGVGTLGLLFGLGAAAMYVCLILLNKRLSGISPLDTTVIQLGVSAIVLLPYTLLAETVTASAITPLAGVLLLTVGVLHTGVAYVLYFGSLRELPAQTVAVFSYLDSVIAILLSALLLKEKLGVSGAVGAVLILGATLVFELTQMRKKQPARKLRLMDDDELRFWYETELTEAFVPQERKPLSDILALRQADTYDVWGLFEGACGKERMVGYATVSRVPGTRCVLLDYLGVTSSHRGGGLGGQILELLKERYPKRPILVEAELPKENDDSEENRICKRRVAFYQRGGFYPVYVMATCGMRWQALMSGDEIAPDAPQMQRIMAEHRTLYGPERTDVMIPILPGQTPKLPYWVT